MTDYDTKTIIKDNQQEQNKNRFTTDTVRISGNRIDRIEQSLHYIFETEMKSSDSIILDYKSDVIHRIAEFLAGNITRSASIGIAGETASGKSTITLDIIETINAFTTEYDAQDLITRVNTDDYYYDRSDMVKKAGSFAEFAKHYDLDVPQALELELMSEHIKQLLSGNEVLLPKYDMSGTAIREHIQKERFYIRAEERGLGSSADSIYNNANEKAQIYIRPCKEHADIVLSGESDRARYKHFLNKIIAIVQNEYFS